MHQGPNLRTPRLAGGTPDELRRGIRDAFHATFNRYEQLFEVLRSDEAYYVKPIELRHPLIFYFGHTATFFVNKLVLAGVLEQRIDPRFESMFAIGVDEMSWDDLNDAHYDWPSVDAVRAYRARVRELVGGLIDTLPLSGDIGWDSPWWVIVMGIEHERIHLETSSVLIRQHRLAYVRPSRRGRRAASTAKRRPTHWSRFRRSASCSAAIAPHRRITAGTTSSAGAKSTCRRFARRATWSATASSSVSSTAAATATTACGATKGWRGGASPAPNTRPSGCAASRAGRCA